MVILNKIKLPALILGLFLFVMGIYSCIKVNSVPIDFDKLKESDIKSGVMIEGDIPMNFGVYEESYTTHYGIQDKSTMLWFYIIPVGDKYMGIAVNSNNRGAEFDKQTEQTYDWIDDEKAPDPKAIHVKGVTNKMNDQEKGFFKEALMDGGYSASEAEQVMIPFYIRSDSYSDYMTLIIVGAIAILIGIVSVIVTKKNGYGILD